MKREKSISETPTIKIVSMDTIKEMLKQQKERCKANIKDFCIDKAVELFYGYHLGEDDKTLFTYNEPYALEILKFLSGLIDN